MTMEQIIQAARQRGVSDIHISEGMMLKWRVNGQLIDSGIELSSEECRDIILGILSKKQREQLENGSDLDFAIQTPDGFRQRVNVFRYQRKIAATIRLLNNRIPMLEELGLPLVLRKMADEPRGLILVTGPTGSGKSTTLASMIDYINATRAEHILTIEDPIEYVYEQKYSVIHQREVGEDVSDFASALRSALREDPDVILVGEMRDYETISAAVTAAETGHLVLSTLHTTGAAMTVDRIIDACPSGAQNQIRTQMASVLCGVVTQTLIPNPAGSGRFPATEILVGTDAALNLIRENKCHQINTVMQSGAAQGMHSMNMDLTRLVREGKITRESAMKYSNNRKELLQYL